ncbi:MAG: ATP-binding protein [Chloroflexota bacterium]
MVRKPGDILPTMKILPPVATESLQPPVCPKCNGAGFLVHDVPYGHPLFGRAMACDCLNAHREEQSLSDLQELSGLTGGLRTYSLANFDAKVSGLKEAYEAARTYSEDPQGWLVLVGPVGCGKTHLAAAIANYALECNSRCLFVNTPDLLDHLRSTFGPTSPVTYDERFEQVRIVELLVLDDLGTESSTDWAKEKIYQILNHRYVNAMPTVITMNPREYERLDERIRSRMGDGAISKVVFIHEPSERRRRVDPLDYRTRKSRRVR